ncbi:MAG: lipopolysaccharide heptosyltransferase I [Phycisphaerae bacterium]|nr:lipopolysaccharide heptosyltransferase I [Phycisphaerae bacterium]
MPGILAHVAIESGHMSEPQRILIIKPSALGDIVHTLPILHLIRERWPEAHIAWLVNPSFAGLIQGNPELNEVISFDRKRYGRGWRNPIALWRLLQFLWMLRGKRFDLAIDLQGLFRSGFLTRITGAKRRIGFANAREGAPLFYTERVVVGDVEQHALERYLTLADSLGCGREPVRFVLPRAPLDADAVPLVREPYAVLLPGTNWATKRWPIEYFANLVEPLRERFGLRTIVAGAPDVIPLANQIQSGQQIGNLAGKTTLPQLVTLLERASVIVANDSGPMHIASALGRPLVTIFGPTNPVRTGPFGRMETVVRLDIVCSPCYSRTCSHTSCMKWLTPENVMREVENAISRLR